MTNYAQRSGHSSNDPDRYAHIMFPRGNRQLHVPFPDASGSFFPMQLTIRNQTVRLWKNMTSYYRLPEATTLLAWTDDLTNSQDYVNCPGVLSMFTLDTESTASHFSNLIFKLPVLFSSNR